MSTVFKSFYSSTVVAVIIIFTTNIPLFRLAEGYLDVNQYCKAFDVNFRPIICIIKNGTNPPANYNPPPSTNPPPPPYPILYPDYIDYDEDDDCSCEVTCIPRIFNQRSVRIHLHRSLHGQIRVKRSPSTSYRCRSCGTECPVSTNRLPRCNCVIPTAKAECNCTVTCAMFRDDDEPYYFQNNDDLDDANCIISVTHLEDWRLGEERPPYTCECKRSKEAENTSRPDFVCVCERVSNE